MNAERLESDAWYGAPLRSALLATGFGFVLLLSGIWFLALAIFTAFRPFRDLCIALRLTTRSLVPLDTGWAALAGVVGWVALFVAVAHFLRARRLWLVCRPVSDGLILAGFLSKRVVSWSDVKRIVLREPDRMELHLDGLFFQPTLFLTDVPGPGAAFRPFLSDDRFEVGDTGAGPGKGVATGFVLLGTLLLLTGFLMPNRIHRCSRGGPETSAIGSLKTLIVAQELFRERDSEKNGRHDYAAELTTLARAELVDDILGSGGKFGYRFELGAGPDRSTWWARATPTGEVDASHHFYADETGIVRFANGTEAGPDDPAID